MPNNVYSRISVVGPAEEVERFREAARGRYPKSGDTEGMNHDEGEGKLVEFCAYRLVSLPKLFSKVNYSERGYHMESETWGIKWGTSDESPPVADPGIVTYHVYTPWSAPTQILEKTSPKWPKLRFILSWGGEGPTRGRVVYAGREQPAAVVPEYKEEDYPKYDDDNMDEAAEREWSDAYDAVENSFFNSHLRVVAATLSEMSEDTPDGILADWLIEHDMEDHAKALLGVEATA